nr:hypothetical protein CFP56_03207 [Quercus suber]
MRSWKSDRARKRPPRWAPAQLRSIAGSCQGRTTHITYLMLLTGRMAVFLCHAVGTLPERSLWYPQETNALLCFSDDDDSAGQRQCLPLIYDKT